MNQKEILQSVLDNTYDSKDREKQGILAFGKMFFPDFFYSGFSSLHHKMTQLLFSLLLPEKERRMDRQAYFLVHREAAKSTVGSFLFPMYLIMLKGYKPWVRLMKDGWEGGTGINNYDIIQLPKINEDFIVIASETSTQSGMFVNDIKTQIDIRQDMANIFGEKKPGVVDSDERDSDKTWTKSAFVTSDNTVVWGVGAGQRVRGRKVNGHRPSLVIVDDMYSRFNTKTEQTRESLNYWFFSELVNSTDSIRGKVLWLGTLVHPDTVVNKFRKSEDWYGIEQPIIGLEELNRVIPLMDVKNDYAIPDKSILRREQQSYKTLSWPERHDLYYILKLYKDAAQHGQLNYFYQEYMNESIAPETVMIKPEAFKKTKFRVYRDKGIQMIEVFLDYCMWRGELKLEIGVDMASSLSTNSDDTVICVAGYCRLYPYIDGYDTNSSPQTVPNGRIFPVLVHIEAGKYDIHDTNGHKGICNALINLCLTYKIDHVVIEANGQQETIVRNIRSTIKENVRLTGQQVIAEYVTGNKAERIMSILLPIVQKYDYFLCCENPLIDKMYMQIITLGVSDHDDLPDALEECYKYNKIPIKVDFNINKSKFISTNNNTNMHLQLSQKAWELL